MRRLALLLATTSCAVVACSITNHERFPMREPPYTDCYEPTPPKKPTPLEDAMRDRDALAVALKTCRFKLRKVVEEWPSR